MFNPLLHKTPYGASVAGQPTEFVFPLPCDTAAERVFVVLRKGEEEVRGELSDLRTDRGEKEFRGSVTLSAAGVWHYRFEAETRDGKLYFGRDCGGNAICGEWLSEWQFTVTECDYKTPDWAKRGVIYHIFADRFAREGAPVKPDKGRLHEDWYELPDIAEDGKDYKADDFFGGNLKGIISKLDYLCAMGVSTVYLSPVFRSFSNHRYDTADYLSVDKLLGSDDDLRRLCRLAAEKGIRVILDGVFNHTGADSIYFNKFGTFPAKGAYQSKNSEYRDWYYFYDFPDDYHCWWGSTVVPTVNKSSAGYRKLICGKDGVIEKWSKAGISGWRLDVVDELPTDFTQMLCGKIKDTDSDALIIGEVWEDASDKVSYGTWRPYFMGHELDGVMNYPFKRAIFGLITTGDVRAFRDAVSLIAEHYPKQSLDVCMTLLGSHDTVRALTALSCADVPFEKEERRVFRLSDEYYAFAKLRLKAAAVLQYTLPGVPCVYYGDEAGMQGFEDPLNRGTYPWGREDDDLIAHYRALGRLRKRHEDAFTGRIAFADDGELAVYDRIADSGKRVRVFYNPCFHSVVREVYAKDAFTGDKVDVLTVPPLSACVIEI